MTVPVERSRAVVNTREFLYALMTPSRTPRVPRDIRQQARALLKHYPAPYDIEQLAQVWPTKWGNK
jgi:hypothetical protein